MPAENPTTSTRPVHPISGYLVMATLFPDEEIWAPIPGFPGYEVSSKARARSYWKLHSQGYHKGNAPRLQAQPQTYLKPSPNPRGGHPRYGLTRNKKVITKQTGFWMLCAFVCPHPGKKWYCCHRDGDCHNNDLTNLRWDTKTADAIDRVAHGKHPIAKLNPDVVREIRRMAATGQRTYLIARSLGVSWGCVHQVRNNRLWRWVPDEDSSCHSDQQAGFLPGFS